MKEEAFDLARKKFKETLTNNDYVEFLEDAVRFAVSQENHYLYTRRLQQEILF
ncbi:MAG: hypothetical protein QXP97_00855 [Desulfurococcus sp.]|jgi:glutamate mutase epsilon subunit|uniref:hypothetical protein n=1 Tax=Desulfurococcus sp. TaxID=51678 RepID=UPI003164B6A4